MDFLGITLIGWVSITVALSMTVLAGAMFILGSTKVHFTWGIFCLVTATWSGTFYVVTLATTPDEALFWWKITYISIILVPFTFFHFVLEFINSPRLNRFKSFILAFIYGTASVFLILTFTTNLIINKVTFLFNELYYDTPPGILHP